MIYPLQKQRRRTGGEECILDQYRRDFQGLAGLMVATVVTVVRARGTPTFGLLSCIAFEICRHLDGESPDFPEARFWIVARAYDSGCRAHSKTDMLLLLTLSIAYCGWKAGLRAEIALNGFQLSVPDAEILHIPKRFTVLGVTKILYKSIIGASSDPLQVNMSNEIDLGVPALGFESALADMVVARRARKGKVVGKQGIERIQVLVFPRRVPLTDNLLVR